MMSERIDDGGPAFSMAAPADWSEKCYGMSLRDYFAGQVMVGILAGQEIEGDTEWNEPALASTCYRMADALLQARKGGGRCV